MSESEGNVDEDLLKLLQEEEEGQKSSTSTSPVSTTFTPSNVYTPLLETTPSPPIIPVSASERILPTEEELEEEERQQRLREEEEETQPIPTTIGEQPTTVTKTRPSFLRQITRPVTVEPVTQPIRRITPRESETQRREEAREKIQENRRDPTGKRRKSKLPIPTKTNKPPRLYVPTTTLLTSIPYGKEEEELGELQNEPGIVFPFTGFENLNTEEDWENLARLSENEQLDPLFQNAIEEAAAVQPSQREEEEFSSIVKRFRPGGIVGMICTDVFIPDMYKLHLHLRNSYLHTRYLSLSVSLSNPKCGLILHQKKGAIVSIGCKSELLMQGSLMKMVYVLRKLTGLDIPFRTPLIMNMIQILNLQYTLDLEGLEDDLNFIREGIETQPLQSLTEFPGRYLVDTKQHIFVTVFESGTLTFQVQREPFDIKLGTVYKANRDRAKKEYDAKIAEIQSRRPPSNVRSQSPEWNEFYDNIKAEKEKANEDYVKENRDAILQDNQDRLKEERKARYPHDWDSPEGFKTSGILVRMVNTYRKLTPLLEKYRRIESDEE